MNEIKDLQDVKYWDLGIKGSFRVLQLRQEWDRDTCIKLRDEIISALKLQELVKDEIKSGGRIELSPLALQSLVDESEK